MLLSTHDILTRAPGVLGEADRRLPKKGGPHWGRESEAWVPAPLLIGCQQATGSPSRWQVIGDR